MDKLTKYREIVRQILNEYAKHNAKYLMIYNYTSISLLTFQSFFFYSFY